MTIESIETQAKIEPTKEQSDPIESEVEIDPTVDLEGWIAQLKRLGFKFGSAKDLKPGDRNMI